MKVAAIHRLLLIRSSMVCGLRDRVLDPLAELVKVDPQHLGMHFDAMLARVCIWRFGLMDTAIATHF